MRNELKQQSLPWDEPSEDSLVDEEPIVQPLNQADLVDMVAPAPAEMAAPRDVDEIMPYQPGPSVTLETTLPVSQEALDGIRIACEKRDAVLAKTGTGIQVPKPVPEPEFNGAVEAANNATGTPVSSLEELAATLHNLSCNGTVEPPADAEAAELAKPEADCFVEPGAAAPAEMETPEFSIPETAEIAADFDDDADPQPEQAPFVLETSAANVAKTPITAVQGGGDRPRISANTGLEPDTFVPAGDGWESVGRKLREARERLHLSVSEVAEATRIRNDYIIALEQHTINATPLAPVYVKSYIKSLCRHYDIRADALLSDYTSALPPGKTSQAGLEQIDEEPPATSGEERFSMAVKWSMVAIFALIAVLTISFFVTDRNFDVATVPPKSTLQPLQEKDLGRFMPPSEVPLRKLEVPEN